MGGKYFKDTRALGREGTRNKLRNNANMYNIYTALPY